MFTARCLAGSAVAAVFALSPAMLYGADARQGNAEAVEEDALALLQRSLEYQKVRRRIATQARVGYWHNRAGEPRASGVYMVTWTRYDQWAEAVTEVQAMEPDPFSSTTRMVVAPQHIVWLPGLRGTMPTSISYAGPKRADRFMSLGATAALDSDVDGCPALIWAGDGVGSELRRLRKLGKERVGGWECEIVEGENRYGEFRLWIAPERQFHQLRWQLVQRQHHAGADMDSDKLIRDQEPWKTEHGLVKVECWIHECEITHFVQIDGKLIPSMGIYRGSARGEDGTLLTAGERSIRRTEIKLLNDRAEVEDAFKFEVPDGTFVNNLDDPSGVQYEWRGGRVVRGHTQFGGAARGHWQPRSPWVYICWVVLALGLAGTALRVWYVRRAKAAREAP